MHYEWAPRMKDAAEEGIMTKKLGITLALATLVALSAPLSVVTHAAELRFRIPFTFTVNGTSLPPGDYTMNTDRAGLVIRGLVRGAVILANPTQSNTPTDAKAVFDKIGDQYTLREVWVGGSHGVELPRSKADRDRARTANAAPVEVVMIAAK